ncbi:MAG: hypothetical protein Q8R98_26860 [Rubrivivax sp.]|nr:hypothetical protein [Rubrivivax sp.]MDP3615476.1 hypothetical protein [Rubrivivax sp.]
MPTRTARRVLLTCMTFALPAGIAASAAAAGQPQAAAIAWHCTQEADASFHVLCVPRQAEAGAPDAAPAATAAPGTAGLAAFADMRPVAQRGDTEVYSAPAWRVPLHARPTDIDMVQQLLKSVLCGTHPSCRVSYDNERIRVAGG